MLPRLPLVASLCAALTALAGAIACGLDTDGTYEAPGLDSSGGPGEDAGSSSGAASGGGGSSGYASSGGGGSSGGGIIMGDDGGAPSDDGGGPGATDAPPGSCNLGGVWASKLTIDVSWAPQGLNSIILASGTGQIKQWIRGTRKQQGTALADSTVVCGIDLPDFQSTALASMETYGVVFPPSLFDNNYLPIFTVNGTVSGPMPGATYSTTPTAALLGISLTSPTTQAWPSTVTTSVDMDMDSKPGVSIQVASGVTTAGTGVYSDVPVGIPAPFQATVRADRLYVAIRQVTTVSGTLTDCDHITGVVSIPSVGGKAGIDSHVLGCALVDGGDCSTTQATFVDNTQPVFTPTGSGTLKSMRVPAGTTCSAVRQMLP